MKIKIISVPLTVFLFSLLALNSIEVKAQYLPFGPQTDVPVATVTGGGWTECFRDTYSLVMDSDEVLSDCPGELLMLSCRPTGSSTLQLLAQGERSDVTFDTGDNLNVTHEANGVGWYFSTEQGSWGFARAGYNVNKVPCDFELLVQSNANERLCWHVLPTDEGGARCGVDDGLGPDSDSFERIVYMASAPTAAQIPTLSEWGLIAMAGILGIVGFMVIRRRKVTA